MSRRRQRSRNRYIPEWLAGTGIFDMPLLRSEIQASFFALLSALAALWKASPELSSKVPGGRYTDLACSGVHTFRIPGSCGHSAACLFDTVGSIESAIQPP